MKVVSDAWVRDSLGGELGAWLGAMITYGEADPWTELGQPLHLDHESRLSGPLNWVSAPETWLTTSSFNFVPDLHSLLNDWPGVVSPKAGFTSPGNYSLVV